MNASIAGNSLVNVPRTIFICPSAPHYVWDLEEKTSLQLAIAVASVTSLFTIFFNILVIVAILKTNDLRRKKCNILITSLAATYLLEGAVSTPLAITTDAIILQGTVLERNITCSMVDLTVLVMYSGYAASYYHLILLGWERYVAIVKCMEYNCIVTKRRLKRFAVLAWIAAFTGPTLYIALQAAGVSDQVFHVLDIVFSIVWFIGEILKLYFYFKIYIEIRKGNRRQISQVDALIKARQESRIAFTVFLLTADLLILSVPLIIAHVFSPISPFMRANSVFRWAEIVFQLNSIVNPTLYFYRHRRHREAVLDLLNFRKPHEIQSKVHTGRHARRPHDFSESVSMGEVSDTKRAKRFVRSQSWAAETRGYWIRPSIVRRGQDVAVIERRMSYPHLTSYKNLYDVFQPDTRTVTVQIERASIEKREKPTKRAIQLTNDNKDLTKASRLKLTRSKSLDETAFVIATNTRQKPAPLRRNSTQTGLAIEIGP